MQYVTLSGLKIDGRGGFSLPCGVTHRGAARPESLPVARRSPGSRDRRAAGTRAQRGVMLGYIFVVLAKSAEGLTAEQSSDSSWKSTYEGPKLSPGSEAFSDCALSHGVFASSLNGVSGHSSTTLKNVPGLDLQHTLNPRYPPHDSGAYELLKELLEYGT